MHGGRRDVQRQTDQSTATGSSLLELGDHYARANRTREAVPVSHHLAGNPLFTQAAIADLADTLPAASVVSDKADQALISSEGPPRGSEPRPGT